MAELILVQRQRATGTIDSNGEAAIFKEGSGLTIAADQLGVYVQAQQHLINLANSPLLTADQRAEIGTQLEMLNDPVVLGALTEQLQAGKEPVFYSNVMSALRNADT